MKYISLIFAFFLSFYGLSATYYVSNSGSDNNNGSAGSPFRTVKKAASSVSAGDVVLISGGTYTEENIIPSASGSEGNYIVFKSNPGSGTVTMKHPGTSPTGENPLFNLSNRSYIWIEGLTFKGFSYGRASIYMNNSTGNVVTNNRFEDLGNREVANWDGNQQVGIYNGKRNVVVNNYFNNIYGDGINVNSQRSENNLVCFNTFENFTGKLRSWGGSYTFSRAVDMQDMSNGNNVTAFNYANDVVHHVWLDRDGSNNIILRNYGNGGSGNVFNESRCRNNVIQENIAVGMTAGYMSSYYSSTSWTLYPRYVNNVAYKNTDGFVIHKSLEDHFRNNIAYNNSGYNIEFSRAANEQGPHVFNNNLWYSDNKTNSILYNHIPSSTPSYDNTDNNGNPITFPAYGSTSSGSSISPAQFHSNKGDAGGLSSNPQFVSNSNFRLQASSPAKGAGDNGLDLGAFAHYDVADFGWNSSFSTSDVAVYFEDVMSTVTRGTGHSITIRLSKAANQTVSVDVVPVAGDAVDGEDFALATTTVTFNAGETTKTITLETGNSAEYDELVALRLQNATNATANGRILHIAKFTPGSAAPVAGGGNNDPVTHFYLCFGQSNMSGQGPVTPEYETVSDRFKVLRAANHSGQTVGEIYPALAPLGHSASQMGPADFFGRRMVELTPDNVTIVVANIAVGSQPIDAFHPDMAQAHYDNAVANGEWYRSYLEEYGGNLYDRIIEMGEIAKQQGEIKGILFHQGENDSNQPYWGQRVEETYLSILEDLNLNQDDVPFLVGELGHSNMGGTLGGRNAGIANVVAGIDNAHLISSDGAEMLVEPNYTLHFTRDGYKVLGERYADRMFSLLDWDTSTPSVWISGPSVDTSFEATATNPVEVEIRADVLNTDDVKTLKFFMNGDQIGATEWVAPYFTTVTFDQAGVYEVTAEIEDQEGNTTTSRVRTITVRVPQEAYSGTPHAIPGKIELEDFDLGGNGFAYYDDSPGSETDNAFRNDEDVDIEDCSDTGGGYNIGYATAGEWLEYSVNVEAYGLYDIAFRVAVDGDGRSVSLSMDGEDIASNVAIPNTSGWQEWQTVTVEDVSLTDGEHVLRLTMGETDYINMNHLTFSLTQEFVQEPFGGTAAVIPGRIEAENYDEGGEGLGFHEVNANGNEGGADYRNDEVDIENSNDDGGGYNIGYALAGEWLEYTIDVSASGTYDLDLRVAKDGDDGMMHIEIDGVDVTGDIDVPNTGAWQVYNTVTIEDINLTAGEHVIRVVFDTQYTNFNWMEFRGVVTSTGNAFEKTVLVYPNPVSSTLYINSQSHVEVMSTTGALLFEGTTSEVDMSHFEPGCYLVKIGSDYFKILKR